jgi:hypothetical protein
MRAIVVGVLGLGLAAAVAEPAVAASSKRTYARKAVRPPAQAERTYSPVPKYVEYDSRKIPFGSLEWWNQMRREGRLGDGFQ